MMHDEETWTYGGGVEIDHTSLAGADLHDNNSTITLCLRTMIHDDEQQQQRLADVGPKIFLHHSRSDDAIFDGNASYSYNDVWEGCCVDTEGHYIGECCEEESNISISRSEEDTSTVNLFILSNDEEEGGHDDDDDDAYTTITDTYRQHQDETNVISTWHGSTIDKNIVSWHGTNENKNCNDIWQLNSSSTLSEVRSFENEHIPCHHNDYDDNSSMSSLTPTPLIHDQAHYNLKKNYISSNPQTNQYNNISSPSNIFGVHSSNNWPNDVTDNNNHSLPRKNNTMIVDEQWHSDSATNNKVLSSPPMEIVLTKKSTTAITLTTTATTIIKGVDLNVTQSLSDCSSNSSDSVKNYLVGGIHNRSYNFKKRFIWCLFAIVFIGIIIAIPTSIMTLPNGVLLEKEEEMMKPTPNEYNTNVTVYGVIIDREEEDGVMPDKSDDIQLYSTGTDDSMNMTSSPFFLNLSLATSPAPIITPVRSPIVTDGDESKVHNAATATAIANDETLTPSLRPTWLKMTPILDLPVVTRDAETLTPSLRPTWLKMTPILDLPLVTRDSNNDDDATTDETLTPSLRPTWLKMTPILDLPLVARDSNNDDDATTDETLTPSLKPTLMKIIPILDLPVTDNMPSRKPTRVDGNVSISTSNPTLSPTQQQTTSPQSTFSPQSITSTPFSFKPIPRESSIPSTIPSLLPSDEPSQLPTLQVVVIDASHPTTPATKTLSMPVSKAPTLKKTSSAPVSQAPTMTNSLFSGTVAPTYQETTLTALPTGLLTESHTALLTTSSTASPTGSPIIVPTFLETKLTASPTGSPPVLTASPTKSVLIPTVLPTAM
jgi:hypothetical protein